MSLTSQWRKYSLGKLSLRVFLVWTFLIDFDKFSGLQGHSGSVQGLALNYASQHASDWTEGLLLEVPNSSAESNYEIAQLDIRKLVRKRRQVGGDDDAISYNGEIIQLTRPSTNSSFFIKLERKPLVSPTFSARLHDNGEETEFPMQRQDRWQVYSGIILPTSESSDTETLGTAALSVCNENGGLCGLIVTKDEHLVIQPRPLLRADTSAPPQTFIIENDHVLAKVSNDFRGSSCGTSDELRVPKAKLAEAAEAELRYKMSASGLSRKNKHSTLLIPLTSEDSEEAVKDTHFDSQSASYDAVPLASTSATSGGKKVVEIAVFTDPDLYERLRKRFPKDTVQKIKDYVIAMINTMDLLYRHKSLGVSIEFSLVHLEIMKKYPSKLNKNGGKAMAYLSSFCDYAGEKNTNAEMWDHALLLTGMDLKEDGTSSTAGLAWAGTMCYRYYSCSISEGHSFGTAYIITHEIGHSLGMEHDGMGVSQSCDRDKYLMSPTTGPGKVEWSSCSRKNLVDFLSFGSAELRSSTKAHKPTCLNESKRSTNKIDVTADINNLPGKRYDASQQCVLAMGSKFKPVLRKSEPPFDNICWMLYCGNGTHAISTHPALEGSKCDDGKHCRSGKCVKMS